MNLWTMQDLGGCRLIVPKLEQIYDFVHKFKNSRIRHKFRYENDYIDKPRNSGYRSYHLIYEYKSDKKETYNRNMLVELQFRTKLQHLWATAVETMGLFTNQALKAGQGEDDIKRFFALVSSLFALEEKTPVVPFTPSSTNSLIAELRILDQKHNYLDVLRAIRVAVLSLGAEKNKKGKYYLLILNYEKKRLKLRILGFGKVEEAMNTYNEIESTRAYDKIDAVLVSVSSFAALRIAYPNYFSDIGDFVLKIKRYFDVL